MMVYSFLNISYKENFLELATGDYPVDFGTKQQLSVSTKLMIPDGYVIDEMSQSVCFNFADDEVFTSINCYQYNGICMATLVL